MREEKGAAFGNGCWGKAGAASINRVLSSYLREIGRVGYYSQVRVGICLTTGGCQVVSPLCVVLCVCFFFFPSSVANKNGKTRKGGERKRGKTSSETRQRGEGYFFFFGSGVCVSACVTVLAHPLGNFINVNSPTWLDGWLGWIDTM